MMREKLRIGLLLESDRVPAWTARMIERIEDGGDAEVVLLVFDGRAHSPSEGEGTGIVRKIRRFKGRVVSSLVKSLAWKVYRRLIDRNPELPDALAEVPLPERLRSAPSLTVFPRRTRWSDRFEEEDLEKIREHRIDVLIRAGFRILRGGILRAARLGVWSYHHGDNRVNRGGPPAYWESIEDWPATGSMLQILTEDLDNGRVLCRSWSCTHPFSLRDSRSALYWKSLSFLPRKLAELRRVGEERFFERLETANADPEFYSSRLFVKPSAAQLLIGVCRKVFAKAGLLLENRLFLRQWQLRYHLAPSLSTAFFRYRSLVPPGDRFWADPHAVEEGGIRYVFVEEYLYARKRGHISLFVFDETGKPRGPYPVLERPYHLSYPFVFRHQNSWYMIPESAENRTVELYEAVEFPHRWEWRMNLMEDIRAVDATLHHDGEMWWMFVNLAEDTGASTWDELHLFSSKELLSGNWKAHPGNPVVSDCRSARPAGPLFHHGQRLYRPSQNCSVRYGYGLNLARIDLLSEDDYRETVISEAEPKWERDLLGVHSFCRAGDLHVIDVLVKRRRWMDRSREAKLPEPGDHPGETS